MLVVLLILHSCSGSHFSFDQEFPYITLYKVYLCMQASRDGGFCGKGRKGLTYFPGSEEERHRIMISVIFNSTVFSVNSLPLTQSSA